MFRLSLIWVAISVRAIACGEPLSFQGWLDRNQTELSVLTRQFGAGIRFDGYASWLTKKLHPETSFGVGDLSDEVESLSKRTGIAESRINRILGGESFPGLDEHWRIAREIGSTNLEAAFVLGAAQYWADVPPQAILEQNLKRSLDQLFDPKPHDRETRFQRLREKQLRVDAKVRSMFGIEQRPQFEGESTPDKGVRPYLRWIRQGVEKHLATADQIARFIVQIGISETDFSRIVAGDVMPSPNLLKQLALEFGEPIHAPFVILAYELDVSTSK